MARFLAKLVVGTSVITVLTYFLAMAISIGLLAFTHIGQDLLNHEGPLRLGAFLILIDTPFRIDLLVSFLVLMGIYIVCFGTALKSNRGYLSSLRNVLNGSPQRKIPNWFVVMPVASSAILVVVLAISLVLAAFGLPVGNLPQMEPYKFLYNLAYAAPVEEAMFRISTLGLLVTLRVTWSATLTPVPNSGRGMAGLIALSFLFPDKAKAAVGLPHVADNNWRGLHLSEWFLLILTSVVFGVDHFLANIGWDIGKPVTAALQGFALGLVYLSYGAYASILLHWFFDLYAGIFFVSSEVVGGIFPIIDGIIFLWAVAVGVIGIVAVLSRLASESGASQTSYKTQSTPESL